jgi:hypothetical protein
MDDKLACPLNLRRCGIRRIGERVCSRLAGRLRRAGGLLTGLFALLCMPVGTTAMAQQLEWSGTFGGTDTAFEVVATKVASDASGVYVAGRVLGQLPGQTRSGEDSFVRKYAFDGRVLWTRQLDIVPFSEQAAGMAVDATGVYLAGDGSDGASNWAIVVRLDSSGRTIWTHRLSQMSAARSIALHAGALYVGGTRFGSGSSDAVVARLDLNGNEQWTSAPLAVPNPDRSGSVEYLAVNATGVYAAGRVGDAHVRKLDFGGRQVGRFGAGSAGGAGLAVDGTGVYVGTWEVPSLKRSIRKYASDGRLLWSRAANHQGQVHNLTVDASGLYSVGWAYDGLAVVSKLSLGGSELWSFGLSGPTSSLIDLNLQGGEVYVAGSFGIPNPLCPSCVRTSAWVGKLSQALPPQLQPLRDTLAQAELAVLRHDPATSRVSAIVRQAGNGSLVRRIEFNGGYWPRQLLAMPDGNGNGADELVVLGTNQTTGAVTAEVRDSRSAELLARVTFDARYAPIRLAVLPDLNGNGTPDLALLQVKDALPIGPLDPTVRAEVRDGTTGAVIRSTDFPTIGPSAQWIDLALLPDSNGNGAPELATFDNRGFGQYHMEARDALSGDPIGERDTYYRVINSPPLFIALPDGTGNGVAEMALLSTDRFGNWRTNIYDAATIANVSPSRVVPFNKVGIARYLISVPDFSGNGYPELAVLKANPADEPDLVQIKDALTGAPLRNFSYPSAGFVNRGLIAIADLNGNASPEVVVLQHRKSDNAVSARIHDARTGAFIRSMRF